MKRIAKLSLVAAVAVAGLTTANAQPLEEAIKNVDVSGSVVYRYNDYRNNTVRNATNTPAGGDTNTNNYKVGLNLSSKVNEDVKFNSRFLVASGSGNLSGQDYGTTGDSNLGVTLSHAYFGYTGIQNTTVNVGKQGLSTPWTVALDSDGNEQTGTGILALSTMGPVTVAGAYFNQTNLNASGDVAGLNGSDAVATVGVIGVAGPVTLDAWYLDMTNTFDTYTVGAKGAFDISGVKLGADARFASLTMDAAGSKANTMAKLVLTADAGLVDGKIAYAMTDKDGGTTALDADASTTLLGWNLTALNKVDADYWQAVLGFDILSNLNLSANYGNLQYIPTAGSTTDVEEEEIYAQLLYKMSKNLTTYVRYGTYSKDTTAAAAATASNNEDTRGRLQVEYTF
ncbi:MAG: major outer membrane protein [Aliarcobacter sp.]|nr:major outer membrane protein [Aliarcobacter sp.]